MLPEQGDLSRREWIGALLGSSVAVALPLHAAPENDWKPLFFSSQQAEDYRALAEAIVPGSAAARCYAVVDLVLSIETPAHRSEFTDALNRISQEAKNKQVQNLRQLQPQAMQALLTEVSAKESPCYKQFHVLKEWTADVYWSSKEGMRELGWKGQMAWEKFDGCPHTA